MFRPPTEHTVIFDSRYRDYLRAPITNGPTFTIVPSPNSNALGTIYVRPGSVRSDNMVGDSLRIAYITMNGSAVIPVPRETLGNDLIGVGLAELSSMSFSTNNNTSPICLMQVAANNTRYLATPKNSNGSDGQSTFRLVAPTTLDTISFRFFSFGRQLSFAPDFLDVGVTYANPVSFTVISNPSTGEPMTEHGLTNGTYVSFAVFAGSTPYFTSTTKPDDYTYTENIYAITSTGADTFTIPLNMTSVSGPSRCVLYVQSRRFYIPVTFGF